MDDAFAQLRELLAAHAAELVVKADSPGQYHLDAPRPFYPDKPASAYFGGVRAGKRYVSYHLMAVYADPALLASVSPTLKKRMQGKSCFNFTRPLDEATRAELAALTARGLESYRALGMLP